ncbi:MAG: tRNA (adenosine(37)-N6)-dimethylallyltransferase MiaA [Bacteroidales bacterium]|nr:tRNA (adenosine(37)-N6)-dimethylallyltransferase MiaA [Bacteroidales bacterium]
MANITLDILKKELPAIAAEYDAICVLGPTASGKTRFAMELALALGRFEEGGFVHAAEIISADSRQVYRGMDIGTGKDLCEYTVEVGGVGVSVPYHLMDIVDAGQKYNIFQYQRDFSQAYMSVRERGRTAIICGGSGLYIEAATRGYALQDVKPNQQLRDELEQKSLEELAQMLVELKEKRGQKVHNNTDFDTKKRAIRAIEIEQFALENGMPEQDMPLLPQNVYYIGVDIDRDLRNAKIDARLKARLEEGMVEEVKGLLDSGIAAEDLIYYGLEYKFVTQYIIGELGYDEMVEKLGIAIHQFAKRQMTWFRGMERKGVQINWVKV